MEHNCVICGKPAEATICKACARDWARRLAWLLKAGMPALQQIAYKQATTRERSPRHGNTAYAAPPVNETAQALFNAVEVHLQLMGGRLGIKPLGYDRYERARTLMQWADLIRLLLRSLQSLQLLPCFRNRLCQQSVLLRDQLRIPRIQLQKLLHIFQLALRIPNFRINPFQGSLQFCGIAANLDSDPPDSVPCHTAHPLNPIKKVQKYPDHSG